MSVGTSAALDLSLALIAASDVSKDAGIIDVGGGASTLVDFLLDDGYTRLAPRFVRRGAESEPFTPRRACQFSRVV